MKRGEHTLSIAHDIARRNVRVEEIIRDYLRGDQIKDIAARYDLSQGTIGKVRLMYDLPKRKPGSNPDVQVAVVRDYVAGVSLASIIKTHNVDRKTIYTLLKKHGIKGNRRSFASRPRGYLVQD